VEPLALPIRARFVPLHRRPDYSSDLCMPCIPGGRFSTVLLQLAGGLVLFVPAVGAGCRIGPRHLIEAATEAVTECAPPAAGWKTGAGPRRATLCARVGTLIAIGNPATGPMCPQIKEASHKSRSSQLHRALGLPHSFFASHLITVKGLRQASVRSYRDTVRLFLVFTAADKGCKITRLTLTDLTFDQVVAFLRHLEQDLGNHARTRNQRLAALHCLFDYIAGRAPAMLATCQQVAAIPVNAPHRPKPGSLSATRSKTSCTTCPATARSRCGTAP
jgi:hypothetical protein